MQLVLAELRRMAVVLALACPAVHAAITPAPLFGEHAVVQSGVPLAVWGMADPGEQVSVAFGGQKPATTTAAADGSWQVTFTPLTGGTRGTMIFHGSNTIEVPDVVAGEVWFCSGQSNMQKIVGTSADAAAEIAAAKAPDIRQFTVPSKPATEPRDAAFLIGAKWKPAAPDTVANFTAAGYFFAREIHRKLKVPVGIINASWGATGIQTWMPPAVLMADPGYAKMLEGKRAEIAAWPAKKLQLDQQIKDWEQQVAAAKTAGTAPPVKPWIPRPPDDGSNMPGRQVTLS